VLGSVLKPLVVDDAEYASRLLKDLTDAEWTIIAPLLPGAKGKKNGRPRPDDRKVINGVFFVLRTGTPWRDLPELARERHLMPYVLP
jgi:transposase